MALALFGAGLLAPGRSGAEAPPRGPGIFFGASLGGGLAWVEHPQVGGGVRGGATWDVVFGWRLSSRWAVAVALTTWQTSPLGTPFHLHTLAPRVELTPSGGDGLYFIAGAGLGMTDGDVDKRAGLSAILGAGYRWPVEDWITVGVEAGGRATLDVLTRGPGSAAETFAVFQVRFHGRTTR